MLLEERLKQSIEEKSLLNDTIRELGTHMCKVFEEKEAEIYSLMDEKDDLSNRLEHILTENGNLI